MMDDLFAVGTDSSARIAWGYAPWLQDGKGRMRGDTRHDFGR